MKTTQKQQTPSFQTTQNKPEFDTTRHSIECGCVYCEKNETGYFMQFREIKTILNFAYND